MWALVCECMYMCVCIHGWCILYEYVDADVDVPVNFTLLTAFLRLSLNPTWFVTVLKGSRPTRIQQGNSLFVYLWISEHCGLVGVEM